MLLFVSFLLFSACGRKSQPKPPEERAPAPVRALRIEPKENSLRLVWQGPVETVSGDELLYLSSFDVLRKLIQKDEENSFSEIAVITVSEEAGVDQEYNYEDKDISLGGQYEYLVVPRDGQGIEGVPGQSMRVSFLGSGSVVEAIPFSTLE